MSISVIIPSYCPQDYLYECLDSLKRQTLPFSMWEIIIVLNGCNEPWLYNIKKYISTHHMTNVRVSQTNEVGVSNARNIGINLAQGDYITFIDDDDYVSDSYLEQLLSLAAPDTVAASYTLAFSDTKTHIPYYIEDEYNKLASLGKLPFYKAKRYFSGPCMKLIHRNMICNVRFDTRFKNGEDSLFMFAISNRITYVQFTSIDAVYYRRIRTNSASKTQKRLSSVQNRLNLIKAYHSVYWMAPKSYKLRFFLTRILASVHAIILGC